MIIKRIWNRQWSSVIDRGARYISKVSGDVCARQEDSRVFVVSWRAHGRGRRIVALANEKVASSGDETTEIRGYDSTLVRPYSIIRLIGAVYSAR